METSATPANPLPGERDLELPSRKTSPAFYRPELDSLRFFAFLLVFLCHGLPLSTGWLDNFRVSACLGVCLFFLLSSYLICELLDREWRRFGSIHLRAFYVRRALRIWPLYFLVLLGDFSLERVLHPGVFTWSHLFAYMFLVGNWYTAVHGLTMTMSVTLWSISVEEQFYLIWPSVKKLASSRALTLLSIFMFGLSYATLYFLSRTPGTRTGSVWVNSLVHFQYFSTGCLLAIGLRGRAPTYSLALRCIALVAGLGAMFSAQEIFHFMDDAYPMTFASMAGAYLLGNLASLLFFLGFLGEARFGRWRPVVYLGKISYGLYVFHWAMIRIVVQAMARLPRGVRGAEVQWVLRPGLAFALTVAVASLSYRFFEAPLLRYKERFERVRTRPV